LIAVLLDFEMRKYLQRSHFLLNRPSQLKIISKDNNIIKGSERMECPLCFEEEEIIQHLLFNCRKSVTI